MSQSTSRGDQTTPSGQGGESLPSDEGGLSSTGGETFTPDFSGQAQGSSTRDPSESTENEPDFGEFQTPTPRSRGDEGENYEQRLTRELHELDPNLDMEQMFVILSMMTQYYGAPVSVYDDAYNVAFGMIRANITTINGLFTLTGIELKEALGNSIGPQQVQRHDVLRIMVQDKLDLEPSEQVRKFDEFGRITSVETIDNLVAAMASLKPPPRPTTPSRPAAPATPAGIFPTGFRRRMSQGIFAQSTTQPTQPPQGRSRTRLPFTTTPAPTPASTTTSTANPAPTVNPAPTANPAPTVNPASTANPGPTSNPGPIPAPNPNPRASRTVHWGPPPVLPTGTTPYAVPPNPRAYEFDRRRRSIMDYPTFSNKNSWQKYERQLLGQAFSDQCEQVLDHNYQPNPHDPDEDPSVRAGHAGHLTVSDPLANNQYFPLSEDLD